MGRTFTAAAFAALLACLPGLASAEGLAAIKQAGVLRIGTTGDYKPFSYRGADGALVGADITMAKALAADLGVKAEFVPTTWKTLLPDFQAGRFDIAVGGITLNPVRAAAGDFSVPNVSDGKRPIVRCADAARYTSLAAIDQKPVRVVTNSGGTNDTFAHASFHQAQIIVWPDNRTIFDELVTDKADVMVTDGVEVDLQSKLHPGVLCPAKVASPFTHFEDGYLMQKDPALKQAVDAFMTRSLADGTWKRALDAAMQ
ncbi:MAG: transporter substrate-binding domain-containing protein [Rhodospirillales bacterium]|nr:transporter substrate-binding domain-containing protein [Rhodospirillales bacterium]MDE2199804.1 transporter substrate-binding domain-containing protein [Rhodospirillales bacterium]MDE2575409.1 transporter substrate-binding domain-containing protein [Rhodospirillales bacterium]